MKHQYFQPEVTIAQIALQSVILTGSPTPAGDSMGINIGDPTDDQW